MFSHKKKFDLVLGIFLVIALFVIIAVSIILYLLFSRYQTKSNFINTNQNSNFQQQLSPVELLNSYEEEIQKQIDLVQTSDKDIATVAKNLENDMLNIRVPAEKREMFLSATLQIVRMQDQGLEIDPKASKDKILEILNSLVNYEER
ncbi:MAG: hypothetical protein ACD_18C00260G0004 [uncultured bacterium]|nr:MAG: hypothetical protein ACD_18C00260G0004 [uncultured bacterium]OGH83572.1 MAG: hypothetical protein A2488_01995 [Candidatus Magasanikbacteria bacterium RIFOXYC12_FULL_32_21b]OGH91530.1 MAG: hypothetical protein A2507_01660 [Candidatus Magasanikbacteria bacterium RIFOXYD12_FULL_33_17]HAO52064.1 hypothetical protein [Candidatus Magasanikbacteria bacterium]